MSGILKQSPFDPDLLNHTETELDFILEMYALDHPDEAKFIRSGHVEKSPQSEVDAAWERVLAGSAHREMIHRAMGKPSAALMEKLANPFKLPEIRRGPAFKGKA